MLLGLRRLGATHSESWLEFNVMNKTVEGLLTQPLVAHVLESGSGGNVDKLVLSPIKCYDKGF